MKMDPMPMAEWLSGKDIFITGATGFMGIVLVEKLLRCYPDLNRLYLLVREHKGHDPADRMKTFKQNQAFAPLLSTNPEALDKITVIPGDINENECGISKEHQQILRENVAIVFHVAASVRFDDSITKAIKVNAKSTHELLKMAKNFKKLEVFEYVSTAFSNFHRREEEIAEKCYPHYLDWRDMVELAEREEECLNLLQQKLQGRHSNTYVLAKAVAENIVADCNSDQVPAVIIRPSIVCPSRYYPLPGWTNNLNGPMGVFAGIFKGFLRVVPVDLDLPLPMVPVDYAVDGFLVAAWSRRFLDNGELQVFNHTFTSEAVNTRRMFSELALQNTEDPFEISMWYPTYITTKRVALFNILFLFLQTIPALACDVLLELCGKKGIASKITQRLHKVLSSLFDFMTREYNLSCSKLKEAFHHLTPVDQEQFLLTVKEADVGTDGYIRDAGKGVRTYVFRETDESLKDRKIIFKRMFYLHTLTKFALMSLAALQSVKYGLNFFSF